MQRYAEQLILFSNSNPDTAGSGSIPSPITCTASPACPSLAMGAQDAYGGRILPDDRTRQLLNGHGHDHSASSNRTPYMRPRRSSHSGPSSTGHPRESSETTETETETEGETEAETDGETDDEPTIRPANSSVSGASEDGESLYRYGAGGSVEEDDTGDEGGDEDDGEDDGFSAPSLCLRVGP
jgi:hypothetical protein